MRVRAIHVVECTFISLAGGDTFHDTLMQLLSKQSFLNDLMCDHKTFRNLWKHYHLQRRFLVIHMPILTFPNRTSQKKTTTEYEQYDAEILSVMTFKSRKTSMNIFHLE